MADIIVLEEPATTVSPPSSSRTRKPMTRPLSQPYESYKRLVVACDGTWLNADNGMRNGSLAVPSNVTRMCRAINPVSPEGVAQVVYYHFGVGGSGNIVDQVVGGTTGEGLGESVREGYSFICNNFNVGDEIFLIGFSRGAFTARSIAGLIRQVGVLTKAGLASLVEIFRDVQHRRDPDYRPKNPGVPFPDKPSASDPSYSEELRRRGLATLGVRVKAIGVWDTVGSLGAPRIGLLQQLGLQDAQSDEMSFYDTKLSNHIEYAFQALALDERRTSFAPAIWEKPRGCITTLRQVWFPGAHSNIGGGYDDQQLANLTLYWLSAQLSPFLSLNTNYLFSQASACDSYYRRVCRCKPRPWSFGKIYDSLTGVYKVGGGTTRTPGRYYAVNPRTGEVTERPLRDTCEYLHSSVRMRVICGGPGVEDKGVYNPPSLDDWRLDISYDADPDCAPASGGMGTGRPVVLWKARGKERNVSANVLPEAPLWGIERELLARDPGVWGVVMDPKPTLRGRTEGGRSRSAGDVAGRRHLGVDVWRREDTRLR